MESDPFTKAAYDAYTAGVNSYINSISDKDFPLEYKLLNYAPEPWTNMKSALFLKYMAYDLAGYEQDFEMTNAKKLLSEAQFDQLFPYGQDSLDPIIPQGTPFMLAGYRQQSPLPMQILFTLILKTVLMYHRNTDSAR